jgi:hypothetical protein
MLLVELNPPPASLERERRRASGATSYDLCEYNDSHPGMRRQSQALRLVIKQATNAKPVSQANKPQQIIVQANIT